ncbi:MULTISPECIES: TRAM domain-containing protein [unclassified Halomonas]|uniref:TRAM domain-containing protein n=1 Tax=unclassified Halomonas TaxID=2609666 RepID=UPI0007D95860|nr:MULTISPECIES: TRAM domain-containing protein [unclassified Halomonas]MBT2788291.1 TRAM domain-containing protein [Halomonas sp. ISL-106]MBT2796040.1 TRAM domain-containing protein [Halomonas sp. ISL-104]OAL61309.1 23S rRNA (uracil(1939)-C(5))-methyltransferase [Halomonas sp. ALS9]
MAMLGKRRPPRPASGHSGLAGTPGGKTRHTATEGTSPLVIERLAHDGRGVAHAANGKTVFVDQALPGEQVDVAIHLTRKRFDEAHLKSLLTTSEQRVTPPCPHFGHCGGCDLQHLNIDAQRAHKREVVRDLFARQGITLDQIGSIQGDDQGYRRRARLGVKVDSQGNTRLGFRAAHSHRLVDIERCPVLVDPLQQLLTPLRELLKTLEAPRQVGHIELLATPTTQVVLVRQLKEHGKDAERWQAFAQQQGVALGTWLGRETPALHWHGAAPTLEEVLTVNGQPPLSLSFAPGDFLQVNAQVNQQMVAQILQWLAPQPGQKLLDLFAGIGNFSLPMAGAGAEVHAVEGNLAMVARIAINAKRNQLMVSGQQADLSDAVGVNELLTVHGDSDALVLDPPRSGAEAICQALAHHPVPKVVYISCDPATLARDAAHLVHAGYRVKQVAVADMFLHTAHMETLMLFEADVKK